jgi:hypothetical protein
MITQEHTHYQTLVPSAGLEPARHTALPPQDSVSTNSTSWAKSFATTYSGTSVFLFEVTGAVVSGFTVFSTVF